MIIQNRLNQALILAERLEIPEFSLGPRKNPPLIPAHEDKASNETVKWCFRKDIFGLYLLRLVT